MFKINFYKKSIVSTVCVGFLIIINLTVCNDSNSTNATETQKVYKIGDVFNFKDIYSLKIDAVMVTNKRNKFSQTVAKDVVTVTYTYENLNSDNEVLIGGRSIGLSPDTFRGFKAYDKEGNILETYPVNTKYSQNIPRGKKCTANISYAINNGNILILDYYDDVDSNIKNATFITEFKK